MTKAKQIESLNKEIYRVQQKLVTAKRDNDSLREVSDTYRRQRDEYFESLKKYREAYDILVDGILACLGRIDSVINDINYMLDEAITAVNPPEGKNVHND